MTAKLDGLRIAQEIATEKGGRCLSTEYINAKTKMLWECKLLHKCEMSLHSVKNGKQWCCKCSYIALSERFKLKNGLEIAQRIAVEKGGRCLSTEYTNIGTKMLWECKDKHIWSAALSNIKNNKWCPNCKGNSTAQRFKLKNGLEVAHKIATEKGGRCLSTEYINTYTKMLWECKEKHKWSATLANVKQGKWCPGCRGNLISEKRKLKNGLEIAKQIAIKKGGECLSTEYINARSKMEWKCDKKHIWKAPSDGIKNGNAWCPICANLQRAKSQNNSYILYHWKTGEELVCIASYEKATVEYLNLHKINFLWQPKTFKMPDGKTYRPDLYLYSTKKWIEIKGYFRDDAKEKWKWFQSIKPNSELWDESKLKSMGIL